MTKDSNPDRQIQSLLSYQLDDPATGRQMGKRTVFTLPYRLIQPRIFAALPTCVSVLDAGSSQRLFCPSDSGNTNG